MSVRSENNNSNPQKTSMTRHFAYALSLSISAVGLLLLSVTKASKTNKQQQKQVLPGVYKEGRRRGLRNTAEQQTSNSNSAGPKRNTHTH
jgi:hypothetical protein